MIDEPVFVKIIGLLCGHIQHSGGLNISVFVAGNKLCVHAQMADTVRGDLFCQCHRYDFLRGRNKPPGLFDNIVYGVKTFLNGGKPALIHDLMQYLRRLVQRIFTALHHFKEILKIAVIFQCAAYRIDIIQI